MKIFGREPAFWVGIIGAGLTLLGTLGFGLDAQAATLWTALIGALAGVVTAFATRPWTPGVLFGVVAAVVPLTAYYHLHISDGTVNALNAFILAVVPLIGIRPQVSPVGDSIA